MLDAEEVRTFVNGTVHFFETATGHPASVGSPYLCIDKAAVVQDYTGVIGISGNREGKVYFTAPRGMLSVMLMCMNETDTGEQNVRDLVGEVANTISGNARRDFGRNFWPGLVLAIFESASCALITFVPFTVRMMSRGSMPTCAAGLPM